MASDFSKIASALSRASHDTGKDSTTDLDIAQASHALKILKGIAAADPSTFLSALKLKQQPPAPTPVPPPAQQLAPRISNAIFVSPRDKPRHNKPQKPARGDWLETWRFSTAYARHG